MAYWTYVPLDPAEIKVIEAKAHQDVGVDKKELKERWNYFDNYKIQRDLYSSFLIMNIKNNLKEIDRNKCFEAFDNFKEEHLRLHEYSQIIIIIDY